MTGDRTEVFRLYNLLSVFKCEGSFFQCLFGLFEFYKESPVLSFLIVLESEKHWFQFFDTKSVSKNR